MYPDLSQLISMVLGYVSHILNSWGFSAFGFSFSIGDFIVGCITMAIVIWFLKWLAGTDGIKILMQWFGTH